jgi:DNA-binding transcriptional MerR regulator
MASPTNRTSSRLNDLIDGTFLKAISILIAVGFTCGKIGMYLGEKESKTAHELELIKTNNEWSEKLNAEIDRRRQLQDSRTFEKVDRIEKTVSKLDSTYHEKN